MGDVDHRRLQSVVKAADLGSHLDTELRVKVGIVEEEDLRLADDCTSDRDTLALSTGEGLRLSLEQLLDVEDLCGLSDALVDLGLVELPDLQSERHVVIDGHVRIKSIVLEDHCDVPVLRGNVVDDLSVDGEGSGRDVFKTGDHSQRRGLSTAGRTDEDDELLVFDVDVDIVDRLDSAIVNLADVLKLYCCHCPGFLLFEILWPQYVS